MKLNESFKLLTLAGVVFTGISSTSSQNYAGEIDTLNDSEKLEIVKDFRPEGKFATLDYNSGCNIGCGKRV